VQDVEEGRALSPGGIDEVSLVDGEAEGSPPQTVGVPGERNEVGSE
jgi:hypothetical protein